MPDILQPKGVRDFPPEEKLLRDQVIRTLITQFERYGFNPLETPILERYEVLSAKYAGGAEILKETFRLTDQGERELGLRYDLTVPLARFVAMNPNVKLPFKRHAIGTVYRDGPIKLGRYREFVQCDCDIVGADTPLADAQCLQLPLAVFDALAMEVTTSVNSVTLLRAMLAHDGVPEPRLTEAMLILDKLKKAGEDSVVKELEEADIHSGSVRGVIAIAQLATNDERISAIRERYGDSPALARLQETLELVRDVRVVLDPSLARGLSYYTGIVFETYLTGGKITSSVSGGGRYDRMIGEFCGRPEDYPAVGVSFGLEPIIDALRLAGDSGRKSVLDAFVTPIQTVRESAELTQRLRAAGVRCDIDLLGRGISKNLDYANALGAPFVILVGRRELADGKVKLKDMRSGEETLLSPDDLVTALPGRIAGGR